MKHLLTMVLLSIFVLLVSCSAYEAAGGPITEVASYGEKFFAAEKPLDLEVFSYSGNVDIYSWDKKGVKFEITKRLRGYHEKTILEERLKGLKTELNEKEGRIILQSQYKGSVRGTTYSGADIKIFLPKNVKSIKCRLGSGSIGILDDIRSNIDIEADRADIEINRIHGRITSKGNAGRFKINGGRLEKDSWVSTNIGNISVKADFQEGGMYSFSTRMGNIHLTVPQDAKLNFECIGNINEKLFNEKNYETKIKIISEMGKISVNKYLP